MSSLRTVHLLLLVGLPLLSEFFNLSNGAAVQASSPSNASDSNGMQLPQQLHRLIRHYRKGQLQTMEQNKNILSQIMQLRTMLEKQQTRNKTDSRNRNQSEIAGHKKLHIRTQSISVSINRLRNGQKIWMRDMKRTLLFRVRMNRIRNHEKVIGKRLKRLETRRAALAKKISVAKTKRASLTRMTATLNASKASAKIKEAKARISQQLSNCILWIRALQIRRAVLRHRIRRLSRRRRILRRRIAVLRDRIRIQLADSVGRHRSVVNRVERLQTYDLRRIAKLARKGSPIVSERHVRLTTREDVRRYAAQINSLMKKFRQLSRSLLVSRRNFLKIKRQSAKLHFSWKKLLKKSSVPQKIRHLIKKLSAKKTRELIRQQKLDKALHKVAVKFIIVLSRLGLKEHVRLLQHAPKPAKAKTNREDYKKPLETRINTQMKHFQLQLHYEAKRVNQLKSRETHIRHRRVRLRRRLNQLRARRRRFERRIDAMEIRRRRLVRHFGNADQVSKKQKVPSSRAFMRGIAASEASVASLRRRRYRLIRRIRATAAKRRRLAQRATRCRIRRHKRQLRRLKVRKQRFLRRLRRNGLGRLLARS